MCGLVVLGCDEDVDGKQSEDDHVEAAIQQKGDIAIFFLRSPNNRVTKDHVHHLQHESEHEIINKRSLHCVVFFSLETFRQRILSVSFFAKVTR